MARNSKLAEFESVGCLCQLSVQTTTSFAKTLPFTHTFFENVFCSWSTKGKRCKEGCAVHSDGRWFVTALLFDPCRLSCSLPFHFIGASGTGRTTFVNTLCESEVLAHKITDNPESAHVEEGIRIKPANVGGLDNMPICFMA